MTIAASPARPSAAISPAPGLETDAGVRAMANAIRALSMDAVEAAKSGHPGLPMGMADAATVLFTRFLKFDAAAPEWPDRDRFVLSGGHGSMLLYALLYLTGYPGIAIEDLKRFRQLGSVCAGHPEHGHVPGIETTTGPLGQGIANAVGMAIAERHLSARFGRGLVDHKTYVIASDGDLMEGISHEAISLAGHLKLANLIVLFDDNAITIDGALSLSDSTDTLARFTAAGWAVRALDGMNASAVAAGLEWAQSADRPVLLACKTIIGFGLPTRQGTQKAHSDAPGAEEIAGCRVGLNWPHVPFEIPADILASWREAGARGAAARKAWDAALAGNGERATFTAAISGDIPAELAPALAAFKAKLAAEKPAIATRKASEAALEIINNIVTTTIGGSADLTPSNFTKTKATADITPADGTGRYVRYGIREHGMAAAMNGMALHGGVIPYGGTFMVFADYCRPAIRLAALMGQRAIFVMTHDSIGVGEDGPTHQPVEHLASLRAIPNLNLFRPADPIEVAECWELALNAKTRPSVLALSRQNVATLRTDTGENKSARGAYVLAESEGAAQVTLLATGTEVEIALKARELLQAQGVGARVVSMPCWELFEEQTPAYRAEVLGKTTLKVAIEAAVRQGWDRYLGPDGIFVGMTGFGASAPYKDLYKHFHITAEDAAAAALAAVRNKG